jgi:transposase
VVRTWAKRGHTPILRHRLTRDHLSCIGALVQNGSRRGRLLTQVREKAFRGGGVVEFLRHLLRQFAGRLLVVWDGSPIHRSKLVQRFLSSPEATRLRVERLPAYAPELNPVEGIWRYLKRVELRNQCCGDLEHLRSELRKAVARLRHRRPVLEGCIRLPGYL